MCNWFVDMSLHMVSHDLMMQGFPDDLRGDTIATIRFCDVADEYPGSPEFYVKDGAWVG